MGHNGNGFAGLQGGAGALAGINFKQIFNANQSPQIKWVQQCLKEMGFYDGPVNGTYNDGLKAAFEKMKKAAEDYQREQMGGSGSSGTSSFSDTPGHTPIGESPPNPSGRKGNPYYDETLAACKALGLPESWASSKALIELVHKESSWRPNADNPTSSAFGLFQFLDSTWKSYMPPGVPYGSTDVKAQIIGGLKYIKERYGSPEEALAFHHAHNWY